MQAVKLGWLVVVCLLAGGGAARRAPVEGASSLLHTLAADSGNRTLMNNAVWPMPRSIWISDSEEVLVDTASFVFSYAGNNTVMLKAIQRYSDLLFEENAIGKPPSLSLWAIRHSAPTGGATDTVAAGATLRSLSIVLTDDSDDKVTFETEESYSLSISSEGAATLSAVNVFGAMHGLETFAQLLYTYQDASAGDEVFVRPSSVADSPRFKWRGLMIDTSRHYQSLETIYRSIDGMAWNKMNVLHWHIVDGQSFPYDSEVLPRLSMGAYSSAETYSLSDCRDVVEYANDRGVRVVAEFDMPSHAGPSWGVGYPFMAMNCSFILCQLPTQYYTDACCNNPMDPSNPEVYALLEQLIEEVSSVFSDQYFHMGGDEVVYACWLTQEILQWMREEGFTELTEVEQYFLQRVQQFAVNNDKFIVNWQEVFTSNFTVQPNTIIEVWRDAETLYEVAAAGLGGLLSYGWTLDSSLSWEDFYNNEPFTEGLSDDEKLLIHGGECSMWTETTDFTTFDVKVWPRTSAAAERLWSPQEVSDTKLAVHRLQDQRCRLVKRGINAAPILPAQDARKPQSDSMLSFPVNPGSSCIA